MMELYEKVAQEIVKDISGEYEVYDTIEPLEIFLKNLEELGDPRVTEQLVAMLSERDYNEVMNKRRVKFGYIDERSA
jgi:hypothetical protein|tara:strand:- start:20363 stop:20593 length:231 start_codon:yes stop_codon:yes gene_type:complete